MFDIHRFLLVEKTLKLELLSTSILLASFLYLFYLFFFHKFGLPYEIILQEMIGIVRKLKLPSVFIELLVG